MEERVNAGSVVQGVSSRKDFEKECSTDTADCDSFSNHCHEASSKRKVFLKEETNKEIAPVCHTTALLMKNNVIGSWRDLLPHSSCIDSKHDCQIF